MYQIAARLVGDPARMDDQHAFFSMELSRPYQSRPRVAFEISDDWTVNHVLVEAARLLGVPPRGGKPFVPRFVGWSSPKENENTPPAYSWWIPVVGSDGRVRWTSSMDEDVSYGEVRRAARDGALYGDPLQIHIVLAPEIGNGILPSWNELSHFFEIARIVGETLAIPGGIAATAALVKELFAKNSGTASSALQEHSRNWHERGADPYLFNRWLNDRPWRADELARLLGASPGEAEAILVVAGPLTSDLTVPPAGTGSAEVTR